VHRSNAVIGRRIESVMTRAFVLVGSVLLIASTSPTAEASQSRELPSVMVVAKSSNRNEVHYAMSVDDACVPAKSAPMHAYWRMRARGPEVTEPLTRREAGVLGIGTQTVDGELVRFVVNGLPSRPFMAHIARGPDGACTSFVETTIAGAPARLLRIYVKERLFGVDYVLLSGRTADGKLVDERLRPTGE
jgi:hypothetical protein